MRTEGTPVKEYKMPVKRYVQTMSLKDNPELIKAYRKAHSEPEMWKEIMEGIHQVGILEMEIYILGNQLVMIVEAPMDFDWDSSMAKLATLPRQEEWERHVSSFQDCNENDTSDEKWKMMERMFHLYK